MVAHYLEALKRVRKTHICTAAYGAFHGIAYFIGASRYFISTICAAVRNSALIFPTLLCKNIQQALRTSS